MSWLAIAGQVVGTMESGYRIEFHRLGTEHESKDAATSEGFELRESDDFNLAQIVNGKLLAVWWMDRNHHESRAALARIAADIGVST